MSVLECVLTADVERTALLAEEAQLTQQAGPATSAGRRLTGPPPPRMLTPARRQVAPSQGGLLLRLRGMTPLQSGWRQFTNDWRRLMRTLRSPGLPPSSQASASPRTCRQACLYCTAQYGTV